MDRGVSKSGGGVDSSFSDSDDSDAACCDENYKIVMLLRWVS
jgi:hypothetical protein